MKKYLLFDLDGTLTDPKEGITKSVQYALSRFGIEECYKNLLPFIGPPLLDSFMDFYNFNEEKANVAIKYYRERFSTVGLYENSLIDGIIDVLKNLKECGYIMSIATSKPTDFAVSICNHFNLSEYFHLIVGSELDGTRTRKSEVISEVLKRLNATADEAIMIGDRKHDIIGAKETNMNSIGVTFGYAKDGELEEAGADFIANTTSELLDYLLENIYVSSYK